MQVAQFDWAHNKFRIDFEDIFCLAVLMKNTNECKKSISMKRRDCREYSFTFSSTYLCKQTYSNHSHYQPSDF